MVVVLPTPPFWFATAMTLGRRRAGPGRGAGGCAASWPSSGSARATCCPVSLGGRPLGAPAGVVGAAAALVGGSGALPEVVAEVPVGRIRGGGSEVGWTTRDDAGTGAGGVARSSDEPGSPSLWGLLGTWTGSATRSKGLSRGGNGVPAASGDTEGSPSCNPAATTACSAVASPRSWLFALGVPGPSPATNPALAVRSGRSTLFLLQSAISRSGIGRTARRHSTLWTSPSQGFVGRST